MKVEEPIVIKDVDWSNNGFSDVKITVHQSDSNSIRSKETSPSIEIDFIKSVKKVLIKIKEM